jgi:hypothetical protein
VDPKKAVHEAAQITCLDRVSHEEFAILWPNVSKRGKVTTLLVDETDALRNERCTAPLRRRANVLSFSKWALDMPFRWCMNLREDRYVLTEEGCSFLAPIHHTAKALHTS